MNKLLIICLTVLVITLGLVPGGYSQGVDKIGQSGMKWLSIPVGARPAALGNAYTAGTPDPSSAFWNPAAIALLDQNHVFLNQTRWIADINVNAAALSYKAQSLGTFGVHVMAVDWGTFNGTQFTGGADLFEETGAFSPTDFAIGVSYARQVSDKFSFGGNIRYLHEDLKGGLEGTFEDPQNYSATLSMFAIDFGTLFYTGYKDLRLGMTIQNISQENKYRFESFPLPLTFRFGAAMDLMPLFMADNSNHTITLMVDAINQRDFSERLQFGLEYSLRNIVYLRGGYKTNYDQENFTLGAGVHLQTSSVGLGVDYSYLQFDNFDAVHMFSFDFGF